MFYKIMCKNYDAPLFRVSYYITFTETVKISGTTDHRTEFNQIPVDSERVNRLFFQC